MTPTELEPDPGLAFTPDGVFERRGPGRDWTQIGHRLQIHQGVSVDRIEVPLIGQTRMAYKPGRATPTMTAVYDGDPPRRGPFGSRRIGSVDYDRRIPGEAGRVQVSLSPVDGLPLKMPRRTKALVLWG